MSKSRRSLPEINAGSMADIAFLLLIFFLVTTTMDVDTGIARKLPPTAEEQEPEDMQGNARNIFEVYVNKKDKLLVEENEMEIEKLRSSAKDFIDNNGKDPSSSDSPEKAIISLKNDRETEYKVYIAVQNELVAAYNVLRNREFSRLYPNEGLTYVEADLKYSDPRTSIDDKTDLKEKLDVIKALYPQKLSEAEPSKVN